MDVLTEKVIHVHARTAASLQRQEKVRVNAWVR